VTLPIPDDLEPRPDVTLDDMLALLNRQSNIIIFGRPERGDENEPGILTPFRSVVIVGGALGIGPDGKLVPLAMAVLNGDGNGYSKTTWPKLAERLREVARDLELMAALPSGNA